MEVPRPPLRKLWSQGLIEELLVKRWGAYKDGFKEIRKIINEENTNKDTATSLHMVCLRVLFFFKKLGGLATVT